MDDNMFLATLGVDEKFMQNNQVMDLVSRILAASVKLAVLANEYRHAEKDVQIKAGAEPDANGSIQYHIISPQAKWHSKEMIEWNLAQPAANHPGKLLTESYDLPVPSPQQLDGYHVRSFHNRHLVRTYMNDIGQVEDVFYIYGTKSASYNHATKRFKRFRPGGMSAKGPHERAMTAFLTRCGLNNVSFDNLPEIWNSFEKAPDIQEHDSFSNYGVKVGDTLVLCSDPSKTCKVVNDRWQVKSCCGKIQHLNSWVKDAAGLNNAEKQTNVNGTRMTALTGYPRTLWEYKYGNTGIASTYDENDKFDDDNDPGENED